MRANQNNKTLVVIPWLASAAQGDELRLAVTGWQKFFRDPYQIVIVGDNPRKLEGGLLDQVKHLHPIDTVITPEYLAQVEDNFWRGIYRFDDGTIFIPCPRIAPVPGQYTPALDHINKFRRVRGAFPDTDGFIYTCDDIYPVAPFTLDDVKVPKYPEIATTDLNSWNRKHEDWWDAREYTAHLCRQAGLPVRDWVCHVPVYYEWDKLIDIFDRFDADHMSIIPENIYFNMYADIKGAQDAREWRDEVKGSSPGGIRPIGTVKFVTNQNSGWSERLESMLKKHYGLV